MRDGDRDRRVFSPLGKAFLGWFVLGGILYLVAVSLRGRVRDRGDELERERDGGPALSAENLIIALLVGILYSVGDPVTR